LRTFSKVYGLAGLRIGYGFAHEDLIAELLKVKLPFEPSTPAQAGAIAALDDKEWLHRSLELNAHSLRRMTHTLGELGLRVVPSEANFVLTPLENREAAHDLVEQLLRRGVIIRPMEAWGLPQCVRISTGTDEDLEMLFDALRAAGQVILSPVK
jgi:histidinol-phosphate aminotransferase